MIDRIFQAHLEGREHGYAARNTAEWPPLEELWRAQQAVDDWYVRWSDALPEAELDQRVDFKFVGGGDGSMTRGEIILHIVNHTSYHRGFVADLYHFCATATTDLTVFLRDARPVVFIHASGLRRHAKLCCFGPAPNAKPIRAINLFLTFTQSTLDKLRGALFWSRRMFVEHKGAP